LRPQILNSRRIFQAALSLAFLAIAPLVAIGQDGFDVEPSVWDLTLGLHAAELPTDEFADFACGTNGGPPSRPIASWTDYALCNAEDQTGWHEVYFQYDDLYEYVALARSDLYRAALFQYTSVYSRPVIASLLFDEDGFARGLRLVTDARVDLVIREEAYTLGGFLQARYDGDWECEQLPPAEGETPYAGVFVKRICNLIDLDEGVLRTVETNHFRRPGQTILNANNVPTEGYFESSARVEEFMIGDIDNREARLAEIAARPPPEQDQLVARAMDCPGCDLSGAILRRVDLRGANLAGANLEGASFHASNLAGANLQGANLRNANLNKTLLTRADLSGADLSRAMLYEARLDGADLSDATMIGVFAGHSRMISADLSRAIVADSDLTSVRMTNVTAVNASFARSRLWNGQLSRSNFDGAIFARADMLDLVATGSSFVGADFGISNLFGADLRDTDLTNADFSGARMITTILGRAIVDGTVFDGAALPGAFTPP
jgi:uncharacterized protein YjbI with pentapeptide repeats